MGVYVCLCAMTRVRQASAINRSSAVVCSFPAFISCVRTCVMLMNSHQVAQHP